MTATWTVLSCCIKPFKIYAQTDLPRTCTPVHQPVSRGFAVLADAWLSGWLAEICADLRENGSALEMVLHDYALYKSTFTLLYYFTEAQLLICSITSWKRKCKWYVHIDVTWTLSQFGPFFAGTGSLAPADPRGSCPAWWDCIHSHGLVI